MGEDQTEQNKGSWMATLQVILVGAGWIIFKGKGWKTVTMVTLQVLK